MTATQAYAAVKRYGTQNEISTAARFLAYGRVSSVRALACKIAGEFILVG